MSDNAMGGAPRAAAIALALAFLAGAGAPSARAASRFPDIPVWVNAGKWQDSTLVNRLRCPGAFQPMRDSLHIDSRSVTLRFLRDRPTEARPDFGGYRIYRMTNAPDSAQALLIRRFSLNVGSELTWDFSTVRKTSNLSLLAGNGDGTFGALTELASGVLPVALAEGKVNKDARLDLAVANQGSNTVTVYQGSGGGVLRVFDLGTGLAPSALALGDFNADTVLDVVVANQDSNTVAVLLSTAAGGYGVPISLRTGLRPSSVAIADVNGDGRLDVVATNDSSGTVSQYLGTGTSTAFSFTPGPDLVAGSHPRSIVAVDLDGDSRPDLVVANRGDNTVSVFKNLGGVFARTDLPTGTSPWSVAVGDLNGDGKLDLAVADEGDAAASVLFGDGLGGFGSRIDLPTGSNPRAVAIGDMNADGKADLLSANFGSGSVSLLLGDGTGGFAEATSIAAGVNPTALAIGDLTGDGRPDLAVANYSYRLPYICQNSVVNDSVLTFVDPDSIGQYQKVCRRPGTLQGRCDSPGDSIFILVAPPGPHDGFLTWYSVTIERKNTTDPDYEDLFVPDTLDNFARCTNPNDPKTCPNLNHKLRNLAGPVEPTTGPAANLERVLVVPNPYRGSEVWDQPGQGEIHFINLPSQSHIRIYTAAGDLVRELTHNDRVRDFERWDLKNASGNNVASGIYIYRVESGSFHFQNRFVVIR